MKYIDNVNLPADIKNLNVEELNILSGEIREFLINSVSETGGHIASNLGVVELTLALHYAFSLPEDRVIWDVGHQTYVHKIITGRKDQFPTLRKYKGLSGFPKREESIYDAFDTGHSSTSISAAIGMARARDLRNEGYEVLAVIGDGALTGGMAFEALNDVGRSNTKIIVILNDNEMSISPNVGGLSAYLGKIRTEPGYVSTKKDVEKILDSLPFVGKSIKRFLKRAKDGIKKMVVAGMLFEELGFTYMGPVDGHSIEDLLETFDKAKKLDGPLLIHVKTTKGKGYRFAEERPHDFHGVSAFDIETGKSIKKSEVPSYSEVFGSKLCGIAEKNKNVVAITAAMTDGTGLKEFAEKFPDRIFDVGIAEQHAVTMAAGLSTNGIVPVVALYSSFLQRAYDQVVHDVATQNLHVVFAVDRAGIVGNDGETHQGVFDSAFLCHIPNVAVLAPCDYREFESMLDYAINIYKGPIFIRYPRGSSNEIINNSNSPITLGKGCLAEQGSQVSIIASGKMVSTAIRARELLKAENIDAEVLNLRFLKPLDEDAIIKSVLKTKNAVIIDEAVQDGSVALRISSLLPENTKVLIKTLPDKFIKQGSIEELLKENRLTAEDIAEDTVKLLSDQR